MYRNKATGLIEEDFRRKGVKRLHVSYGVRTKKEAEPASAALHRVFREKRWPLIEKVRRGEVSPFELAALIADDKPLGEAGVSSAGAEPWPTIEDAAKDYVEYLEKSDKKAANTARQARAQLDRFIAFIGAGTLVDSVTPEHVTAYQSRLYEEGAAQNTIVAYVWRVSGLYTWLVKREERDARQQGRIARTLHVPIDEDEIVSRQTRRDRWLTEGEAERLLAATPAALLAAVMLGLLAGLRIEEMLHLRPQHDIDTKLGLITIQEQPKWHPKNRKRRVVPIAPQLRPVLEYHIAHYASEEWLFPSDVIEGKPINNTTFYDHFTRIVKNAELVGGRRDPRGVVYHTLRHTFASWLVMKGVDLYTVSQLLGNSLSIVERTYAHLAPDYRQRAVDRLGGIVAIPALPQETSASTGRQSSSGESK